MDIKKQNNAETKNFSEKSFDKRSPKNPTLRSY